jgi:hypothetical protein
VVILTIDNILTKKQASLQKCPKEWWKVISSGEENFKEYFCQFWKTNNYERKNWKNYSTNRAFDRTTEQDKELIKQFSRIWVKNPATYQWTDNIAAKLRLLPMM